MNLPDYRYKHVAGVYRILNLANGKFYLGSTVSIYDRACAHRRMLRRGTHRNHILQRAWNKHGESTFEFDIVALLETEGARRIEQHLLDIWVGKACCYNLAARVDSPLKGRRLSAEHRAKIGKANSIALKGKPLSDERRTKLAEARKKMWLSRPRTVGDAARRKMSEAKRGKSATWNKHPKSDESKRRISETKLGVKFSNSQWATYKLLSPKRRKTFVRKYFKS